MEQQNKILVIEDDPGLGRGLTVSLETEEYEVTWAKDLESAVIAFSDQPPNLVLLDLNLPDGNGIQFLKKIRAEGKGIPIIILTANADEDSVVEGLQLGANDYVKKPFGQKELVARIKTALRDAQHSGPQLQYDGLRVEQAKRKVYFHDEAIELNRREFEILCYFIAHAEVVVTREMLLAVLKQDGEIFDRTIDSHISHIRSRLKRSSAYHIKINSVYGVGYRLEAVQ